MSSVWLAKSRPASYRQKENNKITENIINNIIIEGRDLA
jgi:hypothetical protein